MKITTYSFSELNGSPKEWKLAPFTLENLNLVVGRNSSGKTRLINTLTVLGQVLTHPPEKLWRSGHWKVAFQDDADEYKLEIEIDNSEVRKELLSKNDKVLLSRGESGEGYIFSDELQQNIKLKLGNTKFATNTKLDEIQHPFLVTLANWAKNLRRYSFGSEFGKSQLYAASLAEFDSASDAAGTSVDPNVIGRVYMEGAKLLGGEFDKLILQDFSRIGYPCSSLTCSPFSQHDVPQIPGRTLMVISVREVGLEEDTFQHEMSMGMYRALALLINLHHSLASGAAGTILIDDIGEGLDFERSSELIKLVVERSEKAKIQLIMSTNDRFVMNAVDLKYWQILHRRGNRVSVQNRRNSPKEFEEFAFLGLSNFDFFASETSDSDGK